MPEFERKDRVIVSGRKGIGEIHTVYESVSGADYTLTGCAGIFSEEDVSAVERGLKDLITEEESKIKECNASIKKLKLELKEERKRK